MKKYSDTELAKLRKSARLMRRRTRSKAAKEAYNKRMDILKKIKVDDTISYDKIMSSKYNIKNMRIAHNFNYTDIIHSNTCNNTQDINTDQIPIQMHDILDINTLKDLINTDVLEQPTHISISDIHPELSFIQTDKDLFIDRDSLLKKVIGGHPLRREILFIEYILRNPNSALRCSEYNINAVYDNIPLYLSITTLVSLELILRYIYYTGESIDPRDIFIELSNLIANIGYNKDIVVRNNIYNAVRTHKGKYAADFISKVIRYKEPICIAEDVKPYTLYDKFMGLISVILIYTPYGYQLIADLCVHFFKNVYITPEILYAIRHDTTKSKYLHLKEFIREPDKLCVGSWHSFFEKLLTILYRGSNINGSCYGIYSKLIRSKPNDSSLLLNLLNEIRNEVIHINIDANNRRSVIDSNVIHQGINRKLILKQAREAIIDGIYTDNLLSMTNKAKNKEASALKRVARNKINERKLNSYINKRNDSI